MTTPLVVKPELLDAAQVASMLDVTAATLSVWRSVGRYGIPFIKIGRNVRYNRSDIEVWLQSRTNKNGSTK